MPASIAVEILAFVRDRLSIEDKEDLKRLLHTCCDNWEGALDQTQQGDTTMRRLSVSQYAEAYSRFGLKLNQADRKVFSHLLGQITDFSKTGAHRPLGMDAAQAQQQAQDSYNKRWPGAARISVDNFGVRPTPEPPRPAPGRTSIAQDQRSSESAEQSYARRFPGAAKIKVL